MIKIPSYLQKGDTIGLVCPAGYMQVEKVSECIRVLNENWGFTTKVGNSIGRQFNYFSGTDKMCKQGEVPSYQFTNGFTLPVKLMRLHLVPDLFAFQYTSQ